MSQTAHRALCSHIAGLLLVTPALAGGRVFVQKRRPMPQAVSSQIFVYLEETPAEAKTLGANTEWQTRIRIECVARDTTGLSAESASDAMAAEVYERLMADDTFGGRAIGAVCHLAWTDDESETGLATTQALCIVRHRTPRNSVKTP